MNAAVRHPGLLVAVALTLCALGPAGALPARAAPRGFGDREALQRIREYVTTADAARRDALAAELERGLSVGRALKLLPRVEQHAGRPATRGEHTVEGNYYVVYTPREYRPTRPTPLLLSLHGNGHGAGMARRVCDRYWAGAPAKKGFLLVCPSLPGGDWKSTAGERMLHATLADVQVRYSVRSDRILLEGYSAGGVGAWRYALRYPDQFAGLVVRAGFPPWGPDQYVNLRHLPVYHVHGTADAAVDIVGARRAARVLRELGFDQTYRELPGRAHEFHTSENPAILRWIAGRTRKPLGSFRYHGPLDPTPRLLYWMHIEGGGTQTVEATIGRSNRVRVRFSKPTRLKQLDLYFRSGRFGVELRRPLGLDIDGNRRVVRASESVTAVLESYRLTRDLRRVFTARVRWPLSR